MTSLGARNSVKKAQKGKESMARTPRANEFCPCGSGKLYKTCCKKQSTRWEKDSDGNWTRSVPLSGEARQIIEIEMKEFENLFGRDFPGDMPIFWRVISMHSDEDLKFKMEETMRSSGIQESLIYASQKTGMILSEDNNKYATGRDLLDWEAAIDEYFQLQENKNNDNSIFISNFREEFKNLLVVIGYALRFGGDLSSINDGNDSVNHVFFCMTRAMRTLMSLEVLADNFYGEDALCLVRSVYEGYLNIAYVLADFSRAKNLFSSKIGVRIGTHQYVKKQNGKTDWGKITDVKSGVSYRVDITFKEMAKDSFCDKDLAVYDFLYPMLSSYVHPSPQNISRYTNGFVYDHNKYGNYMESVLYGMFCGLIVIDSVVKSRFLSDEISSDLRNYLKRTAPIFMNFLERFNIVDDINPFSERLRVVGSV